MTGEERIEEAVLWPDLLPLEVPAVEPQPKLSAGRRLTLRQRTDVEAGRHPLTRLALSEDPEARCGNCRFRRLYTQAAQSYPKCIQRDGLYDSRSASSDVRAWWPGCANHEWGDTISVDAARSRPAVSGVSR